jgi:hypothetical protein
MGINPLKANPCVLHGHQHTGVRADIVPTSADHQLTLPAFSPAPPPRPRARRRPEVLRLQDTRAHVLDDLLLVAIDPSSEGQLGLLQLQPSRAEGPTAKLRPKSECAFCHQASAKKDEVWTQFYRLGAYLSGPPTGSRRDRGPARRPCSRIPMGSGAVSHPAEPGEPARLGASRGRVSTLWFWWVPCRSGSRNVELGSTAVASRCRPTGGRSSRPAVVR